MDIIDIVTIFALIVSPILALQIQKILELKRDARNRKNRIFYTLMSTRVKKLNHERITALNMIDIDFYGNKKIINEWKIYHDHLSNKKPDCNILIWNEKSDELFINLLHTMAQYLGYDFDKIQLKRGCYSPIAHDEFENNQNKLLRG